MSQLRLKHIVNSEQVNQRLDQLLAQCYPDYSRARWQAWIANGCVLLNGAATLGKYKLRGGETITVNVDISEQLVNQPQAIALNIVYEDKEIILINKPAGLVVHPAAGNRDSTLLNALLHYAPELAHVPRAGIVHRLDKETSGLLIIARTLSSHTYLVRQLQAREIHREYLAVVQGKLIAGGTIDAPLGRHPTHRTKRAVVYNGKTAITHYRVTERFQHYTLVQVKLETGRTHQIRVHFAHIKHALLGDPVYAGRLQFPRGANQRLIAAVQHFKRQALHAYKLGFEHPKTKDYMEFEAPIPEDFAKLLDILRQEDA